MRTRALAAPLLASLLAVGCSRSTPAAGTTDASTSLASAAPIALPADQLLQARLQEAGKDVWPIVVVSETHVLLDGVSLGDPTMPIDLARLQKLDELFAALKTQREAWQARHPGAPFPGRVGLRTDPAVPGVVLTSACETVAQAGYPHAILQSSSAPSRFYALEGESPGTIGDDVPVFLLQAKGAHDLHGTWKRGRTILSDASWTDVQGGCDEWKKGRPSRDPADDERDPLRLSGGAALSAGAIFALLEAIGTCTRPLRAPDGGTREIPAFRAASVR